MQSTENRRMSPEKIAFIEMAKDYLSDYSNALSNQAWQEEFGTLTAHDESIDVTDKRKDAFLTFLQEGWDAAFLLGMKTLIERNLQ
jgi:hypothetical protein